MQCSLSFVSGMSVIQVAEEIQKNCGENEYVYLLNNFLLYKLTTAELSNIYPQLNIVANKKNTYTLPDNRELFFVRDTSHFSKQFSDLSLSAEIKTGAKITFPKNRQLTGRKTKTFSIFLDKKNAEERKGQ